MPRGVKKTVVAPAPSEETVEPKLADSTAQNEANEETSVEEATSPSSVNSEGNSDMSAPEPKGEILSMSEEVEALELIVKATGATGIAASDMLTTAMDNSAYRETLRPALVRALEQIDLLDTTVIPQNEKPCEGCTSICQACLIEKFPMAQRRSGNRVFDVEGNLLCVVA